MKYCGNMSGFREEVGVWVMNNFFFCKNLDFIKFL